MKNIKIIVILAHLLIGTLTFAQAPEKMSYQAVVRNTTNNLVTNQAVGMQISILQGSATGTAVYVETQTPTSNTNGLVSLEIGGGTVVSGSMASINWANGPYFIKTETDPTGGSSYTITGTSQLLSTPYALYAKTTGDGWNKTGNTGTVEGTNFIGNTDDKALEFRINDIRAGLISNNTGTSTSFGNSSLPSTSTGPSNSAFGKNALKVNTTGNSNTAIGSLAMQANTTGNQNVALGTNALRQSTTGGNNTAIGFAALDKNTLGANNASVGRTSMVNNSTGSNNTALGTDALGVNTTGSYNTAVGKGANVSANNFTNATAIGSLAIVDASNKIRLGDNDVTATDIAGQVKVNAQSATNNFTLPATRGTANQVLSTDGVGATSWVTPSAGGGGGATLDLLATNTTSTAVFALANGSNTGDLVTFNNLVTTPTLGSYNTSNNTYTVGVTGLYIIQAVTRCNDHVTPSSTVGQFLVVDVDGAGMSSPNTIITDYPTATGTNMPAGAKGRGFTSVTLYLTAGQTVRVLGLSANSSSAMQPLKTDGSCKFMVVKL